LLIFYLNKCSVPHCPDGILRVILFIPVYKHHWHDAISVPLYSDRNMKAFITTRLIDQFEMLIWAQGQDGTIDDLAFVH